MDILIEVCIVQLQFALRSKLKLSARKTILACDLLKMTLNHRDIVLLGKRETDGNRRTFKP